MHEMEQKQILLYYDAVLSDKYTSVLLNLIYDNKRDETTISQVFEQQTQGLVQWLEKAIPVRRK